MLHGHRFETAAMQTLRADQLLASHPDIGQDIEKRPVPLEQKDYYLMLSNRLVDERPALAQALWDEIARQRESADYRARLRQVLADTRTATDRPGPARDQSSNWLSTARSLPGLTGLFSSGAPRAWRLRRHSSLRSAVIITAGIARPNCPRSTCTTSQPVTP